MSFRHTATRTFDYSKDFSPFLIKENNTPKQLLINFVGVYS